MYGLDPAAPIHLLRGVTLSQVCAGLNEVILNFLEDAAITILTSASITRAGRSEPFATAQATAKRLVDFLHLAIDTVDGERDGTLRLTFANGETLTLFDESDRYESYLIRVGQESIVV